MTLDEMKAAADERIHAVGMKRHPSGSGWFLAPSGRWLCSFLSHDERTNWIAMLDPADGGYAMFVMCGTGDTNKPVPAENVQAIAQLHDLIRMSNGHLDSCRKWLKTVTAEQKERIRAAIKNKQIHPHRGIITELAAFGLSHLEIVEFPEGSE